jgi:hypothetical protein
MVVVSLGGFDDFIADEADSGVLELATELEVDLVVKNGGIVSCFLQRLEETVELCPNLGLLDLEVLLHFCLNRIYSRFYLAAADLSLLVFGLHGYSCQQFLHEAHKDIIICLFFLEVLEGREQLVVLARLELDLIEDFNEDGIDAGANGFE